MSRAPYGVQLFNDLHNYLPDLIYHPNQFNNVGDVLQYVARSMQRNFNIYDTHRDHYINQSVNQQFRAAPAAPAVPAARAAPTAPVARVLAVPVAPTPVARVPAAPVARVPVVQAAGLIGLTLDELNEIENESNRLVQTQENLATLLYAFLDIPPPVDAVEPTEAQINNATRISTSAETADACSICYENMSNTRLRRIIHCNHQFHAPCIDRWFEVNAHCPICRHDIRQ
jgi:hypothetical protein